jgi:O-antigen ligase
MISLNNSGQSILQSIIPLIVVLLLLVGIAFVLPSLSTVNTIAFVGGLVVFVLSFSSTEIALYILIFSMLLSPEFVVGETGGASLGRGVTLRIDDLLIIIIGISWLARMSINKELGLFLRTPLNTPIAYYIIICLVSTLFGALFGRVNIKTGFFFVLKYFEYMIIYFMVSNHLRTRKQATYYLWALLITCAIVSLIGIFQIPSGGRVTAPFEGASGEPNTLGGYLIFMISIACGFILTTNSSLDRLKYGFLIFLFIIPFIYTQSRSSYLSVIPAIITLIILSEKRGWIIGICIILGLSLPIITPEIAKQRLAYTFVQGKSRTDVVHVGGVKLDTSTSARILSWRNASRDWIKHPVLGFGVTGYHFLDAQYIRVLIETGLLGLFIFFFLLLTIFRKAYENFKASEDSFEKGLTMGFLAGFMGLIFHSIGANTFIIVRIMEPFWFMTAMVVLIKDLKEAEPVKQTSIP